MTSLIQQNCNLWRKTSPTLSLGESRVSNKVIPSTNFQPDGSSSGMRSWLVQQSGHRLRHLRFHFSPAERLFTSARQAPPINLADATSGHATVTSDITSAPAPWGCVCESAPAPWLRLFTNDSLVPARWHEYRNEICNWRTGGVFTFIQLSCRYNGDYLELTILNGCVVVL